MNIRYISTIIKRLLFNFKLNMIYYFILHRKNYIQLLLIVYKSVKDQCLYLMKWIKCQKVY